MTDPLRSEIETWFVKRGVPHFIEGYRATTNVWTRCVPALVGLWALGFIIEVGLAENVRLLAVFGAIAAVFACWIIPNRVRKRRSFARPDSIGTIEILFFVLSPAIVSVVIDRDLQRSLLSAVAGAVLLSGVYVSTSYGLVAITRYVLQRLSAQAKLLGKLSSRAIPLLLLITVTIFLTSETWQMSSRLVGASQVATFGLFVLAGGLFLLTRVPGEVAAVESFDLWSEVADHVAGTPADVVHLPEAGNPPEPDMHRGQRLNLVVMALTTQAVQITLVALAVYAFFVLLGLVAIPPATATAFIGSPPHVLASLRWGASTFAVTTELLRVSGFLAAFSGMAFTVYLVTDSTYRAEFASDVSSELRQVLAVRIAYLRHLETVTVANDAQPVNLHKA